MSARHTDSSRWRPERPSRRPSGPRPPSRSFLRSTRMTGRRDIWQVIDGIQKEAMETIPGIRRFQIKEMGSDVMASSLAPVSLIVYGKDMEQLAMIGNKDAELAR